MDSLRAAQLLIGARSTCKPLPGFPEALRPQSNEDSFAVQDAVLAVLGPAGGWKTGAGSPTATPNIAPLFATLVAPSPARLGGPPLFGEVLIEVEFAFRIGKDLPGLDRPYGRADLVEAIDAFCPAIEVVMSRFEDRPSMDPFSLLADNFSNGFFVYGTPIANWRQIDFAAQHIDLSIGGKQLLSIVPQHPAHDPLYPVVWSANHLAARRGGFRKGEFVTTGTLTGVLPILPGQTATADFGPLGRVEFTYSN
jgi:2-keto-4-pentenoate hydratase